MFTQCPHCQTTFRIHAQQLRAAHGKVRCSQCRQIFNALEQFAETRQETSDWPESRFVQQIDYGLPDQINEHKAPTGSPASPPDLLSELANPYLGEHGKRADAASGDNHAPVSDELPISTHFSDYLAELEKRNDPPADKVGHEYIDHSHPGDAQQAFFDSLNLDLDEEFEIPPIEEPDEQPDRNPRPDRWTSNPTAEQTEDEPFDWTFLETTETGREPPIHDRPATQPTDHSVEPDTAPETDTGWDDALIAPAVTATDESAPTPFHLADDVPDIEPTDASPLSLEEVLAEGPRRRGRRLLWTLSITLLLLAAAAQLSWIYRERLIETPLGAKYLNQLCAIIDCRLPERRDPSKFEVINRSLLIAPDRPGVLQLSLSFTNRANFPQPHPKLSLSLYASDERLIARRTFLPQEYLGGAASERSHIKPREMITIDMALEEPAEEVSGFRFDFD